MTDSDKNSENFSLFEKSFYSKIDEANLNNEKNRENEQHFIHSDEESNKNGLWDKDPNSIQNRLYDPYFDSDNPYNEGNDNLDMIQLVQEGKKGNVDCNVLQNNNILDNALKTTTYKVDTINGKHIITSNGYMDSLFTEKFHTVEERVETYQDLQMFRKKGKRRTNEEIAKTRQSIEPGPKEPKKKGRKKNENTEENQKNKGGHGKDSEDNIMRKINTFLMESVRNWLNNSFIDENFNFLSQKDMEKRNLAFFLKLCPNIINNKIAKKLRIEILEKKIKNIFFEYQITAKIKKNSKSNNRDLIDKIYKENNQPFVIYILELTFLQTLNYCNGQITDEIIIEDLKTKHIYDEEIIRKFIDKFDKIGKLFDRLYETEKNKSDEDSIKDYFSKIKIISLNYKPALENKFERKNKKKIQLIITDNN